MAKRQTGRPADHSDAVLTTDDVNVKSVRQTKVLLDQNTHRLNIYIRHTMSKQETVVGVSGTQSPPLEATGEDKPMGASSVESAQKGDKVEAVSDSEQRKRMY